MHTDTNVHKLCLSVCLSASLSLSRERTQNVDNEKVPYLCLPPFPLFVCFALSALAHCM